MKIYIQMGNAGRIAGIWSHVPAMKERVEAYSKYLGETIRSNSVVWNTWLETYEVPDNETGRKID
jgi:hypothetical protein